MLYGPNQGRHEVAKRRSGNSRDDLISDTRVEVVGGGLHRFGPGGEEGRCLIGKLKNSHNGWSFLAARGFPGKKVPGSGGKAPIAFQWSTAVSYAQIGSGVYMLLPAVEKLKSPHNGGRFWEMCTFCRVRLHQRGIYEPRCFRV